MDNFTWVTPTKYVFGKGSVRSLPGLVEQFQMRKPLLVYGGGSAVRSGLLEQVEKLLQFAGITDYKLLGGVQPNPMDDLVYKGIDLCRNYSLDSVLAIGGGSVIDTAKAIAAGALYHGDFWDFYCGKLDCQEAMPVGVILTIPAAGSEGSGNSVITRREGMHKLGARSEFALRPKFSIMDPELTFTLPPYQTAAGIVDMMSHIFERYFSPTKETQITDRVAEGVLMAIIEEAPKVIAYPTDYEARANIMWSGTLAHNGVCGCGRVEDWTSHAMEHEISAVYGVTHGAGLAVIMPAWMVYMAHNKPERGAQLAERVFGIKPKDNPTETALEGIGELRKFYRSIGMPLTFSELGIPEPDIDLLVKKLVENKGETFGGYMSLTAKEAAEIYKLAL